MHLDHLPGSFFGPSNLVDLLRHRALHQAHDRAFTYLVDGETEELHLSYQGLDRQARAIAAQLQAMNLVGQRALLLYPAGLDFIVGYGDATVFLHDRLYGMRQGTVEAVWDVAGRGKLR